MDIFDAVLSGTGNVVFSIVVATALFKHLKRKDEKAEERLDLLYEDGKEREHEQDKALKDRDCILSDTIKKIETWRREDIKRCDEAVKGTSGQLIDLKKKSDNGIYLLRDICTRIDDIPEKVYNYKKDKS